MISPIHSLSKGIYDCVTRILLTKCEGGAGRISARDLDNTDLVQRGQYKKKNPKVRYSLSTAEQAWLIRDLLRD